MSTKKKGELSKEDAKKKLWELGVLDWKLTSVQKIIKDGILNDSNKTSVVLCSRRLGKCLAEGTEILTPSGIKNIEDMKPGDTVYGYNADGSVTPTKVLAVEYQGEKEVVDLVNHGKVLATSTPEHRWLFKKTRKTKYGKNKDKTYVVDKFVEKTVQDRKSDENIVRKFVKAPLGPVYEPHAYAIGALLGDGCSRESVYDYEISISSEDEHIPKHVAKTLGVNHFYKTSPKNYTWAISNNQREERGNWQVNTNRQKIVCHYYNDWCKGRYAHEKIVDLEIIKTWNRESCLQFLAGLIDTDGSVRTNKGKEIIISFGCQSKTTVEAFAYLFHLLFQYKTPVIQEKRDKYVNGPMYYVNIKNNLFCKMALKELTPYIQTARKKFLPEYENCLENNSHPDKVGFTIKNKRIERCWDIQVDNETSLYLTSLGLVTHNSYLMCTMALEQCLGLPGSVVKFVFPKAKDTKRNILPLMRTILEDCPPEIKPRYMEADKEMRFHNGSTIQFAGSDSGNIESIRGGFSHLCIFDECGFADDVTYGIRSVLSPTTKTTGGRIVLVSTPPRSANHEFQTDWIDPYKTEGRVKTFTIYDNPNFTPEIIQEIISEYPTGTNDIQFRREYLCETVRDTEKAILPSFTTQRESVIVTDQFTRPVFCDKYVSLDIGGSDLTALLFGYYDYMNATLVIEREFVCDGSTNTAILAENIKRIEAELWTNPIDMSVEVPYKRMADNNNSILLTDLQKLHGLSFTKTKKDKKHAALNSLDVLIQQENLIIHPSCEHLIYHMRFGEWNAAQTAFKHLKDSPTGKVRGGHADCLDSLLYLHRNVQKSRNPYPKGYGEMSGSNVFTTLLKQSPTQTSGSTIFERLFKKRKKK